MSFPPRRPMERSAVADALQRWLMAFPRWDADASEGWMPFIERYGSAEALLSRRIRRLPEARLVITSGGRSVQLALAGIAVESSVGLTSTCRIWIARARMETIQ